MESFEQLRLLIFDMDGLLLDSEQAYRRGWLWVAKKNGLALTEADMAGWSGQSLDQTLAKLAGVLGDSKLVDQLRSEREVYIREQLQKDAIQLKPYAREVLEKAREKGLQTALATSTVRERATHYLDYHELWPLFDYVTFGDDVTHLKPDPESYLMTLAKAGVPADQALVMEDSITGATAATRAGLPVLLIPDQSLTEKPSAAQKANVNIWQEGTSLKTLLDQLNQSFH